MSTILSLKWAISHPSGSPHNTLWENYCCKNFFSTSNILHMFGYTYSRKGAWIIFFKTRFWYGGMTSIKKYLENFPIFCPIWNFSDFQYFVFFSPKACKTYFLQIIKKLALFKKKHAFGAVETSIKKTLGKFSSIIPYWKLFGLAVSF